MKKHLLIFCVAFIALIVGINYAIGASKAAAYQTNSSWETEGNRELFSDVKINYSVYGGKNFNYWEVCDTMDGASASFQKKQIYWNNITHENDIANDNGRGIGLSFYSFFETFEYVPDDNGVVYMECSEDEAAFFSPYISRLEGTDSQSFEPVKLNETVENYKIDLKLYDDEHEVMDERDDYILYPVGDEVVVTPYFYVTTYDEDDNPIWEGMLRELACYFEVTGCKIGDRCYVIVMYTAPQEERDKSFTDIYLVSENAKTILAEPKLVKHLDFYARITDMGSIDGLDYYIMSGSSGPTINVIDIDSFDVLQQFEIDYPDDQPGYYSYGLAEKESLWVRHNMIHFKDDKIYLLIPMYSVGKDRAYNQALQLLVYEENQSEPVANAIIYNDLFTLEMDGHGKYSENDYNYTAYNYSFEL